MKFKKWFLTFSFFILTSGLCFGDSQAQSEQSTDDIQVPVCVLPTKSYDFQNVLEGQTVEHSFIIQNKGTAELRIEKVKTG